jgi:hypothetical protein
LAAFDRIDIAVLHIRLGLRGKNRAPGIHKSREMVMDSGLSLLPRLGRNDGGYIHDRSPPRQSNETAEWGGFSAYSAAART